MYGALAPLEQGNIGSISPPECAQAQDMLPFFQWPAEGLSNYFGQGQVEGQGEVELLEAAVEEGQSHPKGLPSLGSALHGGNCRPCAWMWKAKGCMNAASCEYCHLCPEGELKNRKRSKITAIRSGALASSTYPGPRRGT